jgi:FkbM family methyltransferase
MNRFSWLKHKGYQPKTILDIGANTGEWTHQMSRIFPEAKFIMFEANPNCEQDLRSKCPHVTTHICLLGNENKKNVPFYMNPSNNKCTGCSMMKELTASYKNAKEITLDMHRLDDIVQERADIIKIDVQGAELLVLEGGLNTLSRADFVLMEVNVLQYNEGAPMFHDVVAFMNQHNFQIFDCVEFHSFLEYCIQLDFIFINRKSKLFPSLTSDGVKFNNTEDL